MEGSKTISKVIPEGEFNCIWVEAGLVSYKLCDRNYECDDCPFDQAMRQKAVPVSASATIGASRTSNETGTTTSEHKQDTLLDVICSIFAEPFSMKLPEDRLYSRGHAWVKETESGTYRLGIDHYAASLLAEIDSIVFPQAGTSSVRDNPCAWIICDGGTIAVQSPLNGRIRRVNQQLMESAALVCSDPYESGWMSEISCEEEIQRTCLDAMTMESVSKIEFQDLKQEIINEFDARPNALGVTLLDGGVRPRNLKDVLGPARYVSFMQRLHSSKP